MTTSPTLNTPPPAAPPPPDPKKKPSRRVVLGGALAVLASAGGASAWALDRFVVQHVEISDVSAYEASAAASSSASGSATATASANTGTAAVLTSDSFTSSAVKLSVKAVSAGTTDAPLKYFVADLQLSDATALRSAFAQNKFGENITETTSAIASDNNAAFAINGDYYGFRDTGIVIRNGVAFRDKGARDGLAFYRDGSVKVYDETQTNAANLVKAGVWNTLSFGPSLLENGAIKAGIEDVEVDTNFGNHSIQGDQPRTAIGVLGTNHLVLVVVDGRADGYSVGVTMNGLAQIMLDLGATTAYNIDGGGSSTMVLGGKLVNNPLGKGEERGTSDILYVAS